MYTVSNVSFVESLSDSEHRLGDIYLRVSWDPTKMYQPEHMKLWGVKLVKDHYGNASNVVAEDLVAGWTDYKFWSIKIANSFINVQDDIKNYYWDKYGFFLTCTARSALNSIVIGHNNVKVMLDAAGMQSWNLPNVGNLWEAGSYMGFDFDTGAHIVPADTNDIYCDDSFQERVLLNTPGTIANPLYNPLEAMQLASQISAYYGHLVTIHVADGRYEDTKYRHIIREGANIELLGDSENMPKVWVNEDSDVSQVFCNGFNYWFNNQWQLSNYCRWTHPITTRIRIENMDMRAVHFIGMVDKFECFNAAFALGYFYMPVISTLEILDCEFSACPMEFYAPNQLSYWWSSSTYINEPVPHGYCDPTFISTKFFDFSTFRAFDEAEADTYMRVDQKELLDTLAFPYNQLIPMARTANNWSRKWAATGEFVDMSPIETRNSYKEAMFKNEALTTDYTTFDTVFEIRRSHFRDNSSFAANALLGKMIFANNRHSSNNVYIAGRRIIEVDNNTTDYYCNITRDPLGDYGNTVTGTFPWGGGACPEFWPDGTTPMGWDHGNPLGYVINEPNGEFIPEAFSTYGNITDNSKIGTFANRVWLPTTSRMSFAFTHAGMYTNTPYWAIAVPPIPTGHPLDDLLLFDKYGFEEDTTGQFDIEEFEDLISLRPKAGSVYLNAGNPDPAFNDLDGTQQDQGHLGGPNSFATLVARIRWMDEFVPVNHTKIYQGIEINLYGDRSTWPAGQSPTFTWANGVGNPNNKAFLNNGTYEGKNQVVTLDMAGTYEFTLTIDDGFGNTDTETITYYVSPSRKFCVDSRKTFTNNLLPFDRIDPDKANWVYTDRAEYDWITGGGTIARNFDGVSETPVLLNWVMQRSITVPQDTQRYYFKLRVGKEDKDWRVNKDLDFFVFIIDGNGDLLFSDKASLNASNTITAEDFDFSCPYGVASGYFHCGTSADLTFYIMSRNDDGPLPGSPKSLTYVDYLYMALADEETDDIYQDLRLAIRHHKPGDVIQVSDCHVDVPIRIAGDKIFFDVQGGYSAASYNAVTKEYDTRDWVNFPTYLNYLRFAYFQRQNDWAYNAISAYTYTYFPSQISGFHVVNEHQDLPNAWAYDAMDIRIVSHARVTIKDMKIEGVYRAGDLDVQSDSLLNKDNGLWMQTLTVNNCMQGFRVHTEHVDFNINQCTFNSIPMGCIVLESRTSRQFRRKSRIYNNDFVDCGVLYDLHPTSLLARDEVHYRRMPSLTDVTASSMGIYSHYLYNPYWKEPRDRRMAQIAIDVSRETRFEFSDLEIDTNTFSAPSGSDALFNIGFQGYFVPASRVKVHHNTSTTGKDFIGVIAKGGERNKFYSPYEPYKHNIPNQANNIVNWASYATAEDAVTFLDANAENYFAAYNNNITDMRSLIHVMFGNGFFEGYPGDHWNPAIPNPSPVLVRDNIYTGVATSVYFGATSTMTPQVWNKISQWYDISNNTTPTRGEHVRFLEHLPSYPAATESLSALIFQFGELPVQILENFSGSAR